MKPLTTLFATVLLCASLLASHASAAVMLYGTRFVYNASEKEQRIRLSHEGKGPLLVQAWLDDGTEKPLTQQKVPFAITPPIFRINEGQGQVLRVRYTGEAMPQDRESVYYLNVLEIPPKPETDSKNMLQLALRTRVKFFFRPATLAEAPQELGKQLSMSVEKAGNRYVVRVDNPTPYHASFLNAHAVSAGKRIELVSDMVPPFASATFDAVPGATLPARIDQVDFSLINDIGATLNDSKVPHALP